MSIMRTLFTRLLLVFTLLLICFGGVVLVITQQNQNRYHLELNQRLHSPVAMYIAEIADLATPESIDISKLRELSAHLMMLNPSAEVYALDPDGVILGTANPELVLTQSRIEMAPVHEYLGNGAKLPLLAIDPSSNDTQSIFSAWPVYGANTVDDRLRDSSNPVGYIYVVLGSQHQLSLRESLHELSSSRDLATTLAALVVLAVLAAAVLFFLLTRRLRKLRLDVVNQFSQLSKSNTLPMPVTSQKKDELDDLAAAYQQLTDTLTLKNQQQQQADISRRELFASISHDLRTPLTTLQSYLETLQSHGHRFDADERSRYVQTACNHTQRLKSLVTDLFELTRLDNGDMKPRLENFSILELAHDFAQDHVPDSSNQFVQIRVDANVEDESRLRVFADIAMTTRIFSNLLGNALRHTNEGDYITISLQQTINDRIDIKFSDTGTGMSIEKQSQINSPASMSLWKQDYRATGGLGLQIVRKILDLHGSTIDIKSEPGNGTQLSFHLPAANDSAGRVNHMIPAIAL